MSWKPFLGFILGLVWAELAQAQTLLPTWVDDIAPIVYTHCAHCHRNGRASPWRGGSFSADDLRGGVLHGQLWTCTSRKTGELSPGTNVLPAQGGAEGVYLLSAQGANLQRAQTVFVLTR